MSSGVDDIGSDKESTSDNHYDSDQKLEGYSNVDFLYCTNYTMPNYKEVYHCGDCGEHKESAISGYDSFLSSIGQADLIDPDTVRNAQRQDSLSKVYMAIVFDERMLLHFESKDRTADCSFPVIKDPTQFTVAHVRSSKGS